MFTITLDPPKSIYRPEWSVNVSCFPGIIVSYTINPFRRYENKTDASKSLGYTAACTAGAEYQVDYTVFHSTVDLFIYFLGYQDNFYKPITRGIHRTGVDCDGYHGYILDGELIYWHPKFSIWTSKHYLFGNKHRSYYPEDYLEVHPIINIDRWEFLMHNNIPYIRGK